MSIIAALFTTGIPLTGISRLSLMLPLCLSIAIVYKTTRCRNLRDVPLAAAGLWLTISLGMCIVGFGLWAAFEFMV